ncbi:MAG: DUF3800 domain-containing protein [Oscillospiraceae bacterium]|nr:DUF3800 domain-containing protein [Oscillospiraceae bacterium]
MKILSVFCDESGDFGASSDKNAYYLVTMIYHDQNIDLSDEIQKYDEAISRTGFKIEYVHTGPIIRREEVFANYTIDERRKLLYKILNLYNSCDIRHATICVPRKEAPDKITLSGKLARQMKMFLKTQGRSFCLAHAIEKLLHLHYGPGAGEKERTLSIYAQGLFISLFVPGRAGCCPLTKTENHPSFAEGRI